MTQNLLPDHMSPDQWLASVFGTANAIRGGVIKRKIVDVHRITGREAFLTEAYRRGWQVLRNNQHYIVLCNDMPIRRVYPAEGARPRVR